MIMEIVCKNCNTSYYISEDKIPLETKTGKCKKCGTSITVLGKNELNGKLVLEEMTTTKTEFEGTNKSIMKKSGFVLAFIAAICIVSAITMDTSVATGHGSRVNNIGLMNLQTNLLIGGGFAFISAIVLIIFSSKSELSDTNKKCPYCVEIIKIEAVICKHCGKEQVISNQELKKTNNDNDFRNNLIIIFVAFLLSMFIKDMSVGTVETVSGTVSITVWDMIRAAGGLLCESINLSC
jgi:predicted Zn finger-like uncharacterized protein